MLLQGCGEEHATYEIDGNTVYDLGTNAEYPFEGYLNEFINEAAIRGIDLSHKKVQYYVYEGWPHGKNIVGVCHTLSGVMGFKKEMATAGDIYMRKALAFHEAFHCLLGLKHVEGGIMDPYLNNSAEALREDYEGSLNELFDLYNNNEQSRFYEGILQ